MRTGELDALAPIQISSIKDSLNRTRYYLRKKRDDGTYVEVNDYGVLGTACRRMESVLVGEGWKYDNTNHRWFQ